MRREAPNSHPTRIPRHASAGGREGFSKSVPLFCLRAVTFVVGGCRRRYVNKIRRLKGARVYGYTYSSPGYWSIPKENPLFDFLPSTSGYPRHRPHRIRAKIREKSLPRSPSFYYLSACTIVRVRDDERREDSAPFPSEVRITRSNISYRARKIRQSLSLVSDHSTSIPPNFTALSPSAAIRLLTEHCNVHYRRCNLL